MLTNLNSLLTAAQSNAAQVNQRVPSVRHRVGDDDPHEALRQTLDLDRPPFGSHAESCRFRSEFATRLGTRAQLTSPTKGFTLGSNIISYESHILILSASALSASWSFTNTARIPPWKSNFAKHSGPTLFVHFAKLDIPRLPYRQREHIQRRKPGSGTKIAHLHQKTRASHAISP